MEDQISSIIDRAALDKELLNVEKKIDELIIKVKSFPKVKIFQDEGSSKDLVNAKQQVATVLDQLRIKNLELTNSQKQYNLERQKSIDLAKQQKQAAKEQADAEKKAAADSAAAGREKIVQLKQQQQAEQELDDTQKKRAKSETELGTFDIQQGSGQSGTSGIKKPIDTSFIPTTDTDKLALSLVEDQRALAATKEAQKLLNAEFKAGNISQAEYDAALVKSVQLQNDLKISISNTSKELTNLAKSNLAIPNTIEGLQARNAVLNQQKSTITIGEGASPEDLERIKAINTELDKNNELIKINEDALTKQRLNIGNYAESFKGALTVVETELTNINGKLKLGNLGGIEVEDLTKKSQVLANAQAVLSQNFSSSAKAQTAYNAIGIELANVYGKDSDVFKNFAVQVGLGNKQVDASKESFKSAAGEGTKFGTAFTKIYSGLRQLANLIPGLALSGVILLLLDPLQAAAASFINLFKSIDAGKIKVQALNEVNTKSVDLYYKETSHVQELSSVINDNAMSLGDRKSALQQLIALNPDYLRGLTLENFNTDEGRKILEKYNTALERKAGLESSQAVYEESNKIVSQLQAEKQALIDMAKQGKGFL